MKLNRVFITALLAFGAGGVSAQLTVEMCQQKARENYPLVRQYDLIEQSRAFSLENANRGYLPQFALSAKATYQSDVTELPIKVPGVDVPTMRKDQYQTLVELNQTIWDGGNINARKEAVRSGSEVERQQWVVDLYTLNDRVNQLFFGILLLEEQLKQNTLLQDELQRNHVQVQAFLDNGVANRADLDAVRVEQLSAVQQRNEILSARRAYREMLSWMIGEPIREDTQLEKPVQSYFYTNTAEMMSRIDRPELALFDAQGGRLDAEERVLRAKNLPKLGLFVQGGYGNPGLNMLKDRFEAFYVAGVRLSWNFGTLYTKRNERAQIDLNRRGVDLQRETFLFNTRLQVAQTTNEMDKLLRLMEDDDEIIRLRTNIRKAAQAKVAGGTLTVTEMLREITAEDLARQNKLLHEMQYLMALYNLKNTINN